MSVVIIPTVPCIRLAYTISTIKAASRLREAFCKLTNNDRETLLVLMGSDFQDCADLTVFLIESTGNVRVELVDSRSTKVKLFTPDKLDPKNAQAVAQFILAKRFDLSVKIDAPSLLTEFPTDLESL